VIAVVCDRIYPIFFGEIDVSASWFAARLRELRERAGLTQQQLADRAGLKLGGIRDLEQERNKPMWETVLALAGALGVDCNAFATEPTTSAEERPKRGRPRKAPPAHGNGSREKKGKRKE
jgi:transcriptional regulator with XRE-family HTH domain